MSVAMAAEDVGMGIAGRCGVQWVVDASCWNEKPKIASQ